MTATGSSLFELLAIAAGEGTAATVVSLLRRPARARPDQVDWLERAVLRGRMQSAEEALSEWAGTGESPRRIWALDALREAGDDREAIAGALTRIAADVAERPHAAIGARPLRRRRRSSCEPRPRSPGPSRRSSASATSLRTGRPSWPSSSPMSACRCGAARPRAG